MSPTTLESEVGAMPDWLFWTLLAALPVLLIVFFVIRKRQSDED